MKRFIILAALLLPSLAWAQNVQVVKPTKGNTDGTYSVLVRPVDADGNVIGGSANPAPVGAAHEANSQVATSTTAGTLVIARPTRVSCLVRNIDTTITVYIGGATVTTANGMPLKPGESVVVTAQTLWQVIAASGTPAVAVIDEYN